MSQYDNTNTGVMFLPFKEQRFVLQGKVNIEGNEKRIVAIRMPLKQGGDPVLVVYEQAGILYPNAEAKAKNEKAPDYSGPIDKFAQKRWAGWKGEKDGRPYLSMKVTDKENPDSEPNASDAARTALLNAITDVPDDDIPF